MELKCLSSLPSAVLILIQHSPPTLDKTFSFPLPMPTMFIPCQNWIPKSVRKSIRALLIIFVLLVNSFAKVNDVSQLLLHHSGHCIGLEGHESPFFDVGDDSLIRENMVFTIEPGLYIPRLGGFRHSDTIIMHKEEPEVITYYPRDIDDLIIE